ncbi:hypothetical protein LY76DRAFT_588983 [Colletotrichum caudatum]|nr:hypothetical protein LY76DRAFT_588983 [Colletotrichum caudatum]
MTDTLKLEQNVRSLNHDHLHNRGEGRGMLRETKLNGACAISASRKRPPVPAVRSQRPCHPIL